MLDALRSYTRTLSFTFVHIRRDNTRHLCVCVEYLYAKHDQGGITLIFQRRYLVTRAVNDDRAWYIEGDAVDGTTELGWML